MKTQNRSFVVEYKSRRSVKEKPASIWGNTDFAAIVRETGHLAPHLFDTAHKPSEPTLVDEDQREAVAPGNATAIKPLTEPTEIAPQLADEVRAALPTSASPLRGRSRRRRTISKQKTKRPDGQDRKHRTLDGVAAGSQDELAALTAENLLLKAQYVERLRQQNDWLRGMLRKLAPVKS